MPNRDSDVIVIGGGAAGLMAAISAARHGAKVTLIEKNLRLGKKILATGNGRCNLSNTSIGKPESFLQYNKPDFVSSILQRIDCGAIRACFDDFGLMTVTDKSGWVFPRTRTAQTVVDVLMNEIDRLDIAAFAGQEATGINSYENGYRVDAGGGIYSARALVLACGVESLLKSFHILHLVESQPVLGPLKTELDPIRGLDGVRAVCRIYLTEGKDIVSWQDGELLFRDYGLSGIAVFNLSRFAKPGYTISIDFFPELDRDKLEVLLEKRWDRADKCHAALLLTGMVHSKIVQAVLRKSGIRAQEDLDAEKLRSLVYHLKAFKLKVVGCPTKELAQVTRGGLSTEDFDPQTLATFDQPHLFAAGECLDVDGACGGFNLHWAWASGLTAGEYGAKAALG